MTVVQVGEFKARFSEMIDAVRAGQTIVIVDGRKRRKVAALIPYAQLPSGTPRRLGILATVASVSFAQDCAITAEQLLSA